MAGDKAGVGGWLLVAGLQVSIMGCDAGCRQVVGTWVCGRSTDGMAAGSTRSVDLSMTAGTVSVH